MIARTTRNGGGDARLQRDTTRGLDEPTPVRVNWPAVMPGMAHGHTTGLGPDVPDSSAQSMMALSRGVGAAGSVRLDQIEREYADGQNRPARDYHPGPATTWRGEEPA